MWLSAWRLRAWRLVLVGILSAGFVLSGMAVLAPQPAGAGGLDYVGGQVFYGGCGYVNWEAPTSVPENTPFRVYFAYFPSNLSPSLGETITVTRFRAWVTATDTSPASVIVGGMHLPVSVTPEGGVIVPVIAVAVRPVIMTGDGPGTVDIFPDAYWMSTTETYQPPPTFATGTAVGGSQTATAVAGSQVSANAALCDMDNLPPITTVTITPGRRSSVPAGAVGGAEMTGVLGLGGVAAYAVRRRRWPGASGDPGTTMD